MLVCVYVESVPEHLKGYLDRFLSEVQSSLFIGSLTRRVIDELWEIINAYADIGEALIVTPADNESGYKVIYRGTPDWRVTDFHGLQLPQRRQILQEEV